MIYTFSSSAFDSCFSLRERRIIFQQTSEIVPALSQKIVDLMQYPVPAEVEKAVTDMKTMTALEKLSLAMQITSKANSLTDTQKMIVAKNLKEFDVERHLAEELSQQERESLKASMLSLAVKLDQDVKQEPSSSDRMLSAEKKDRTWNEFASEKWESVQEWSKQNLDVALWSHKKKAIAATATLGIASLGVLLYMWHRKKKNAAPDNLEKKPSLLRRVLPWIPVVGVLGVGLYALYHYAMKHGLKDLITSLRERFSGKEPWIQYGLNEEQYNEARSLYAKYGKSAEGKIRSMYSESNSEECAALLTDLENEWHVESHDEIAYAEVGKALQNYVLGLDSGMKAIETWMRNNKTTVIAGTLLAARFGVLRAILNGATETGKKSLTLGASLLRWVPRHPLAALFLMGGSAASVFGAVKVANNTKIPSDLQNLIQASAERKRLFLGDTIDIGEGQMEKLYEFGAQIGSISSDVATWVGQNLSDFIDSMAKSIPEMMGETREEVIVGNHESSTTILRVYLDGKLLEAQSDQNKKDKGDVQKYERAIGLLAEFHDAHMTQCISDGISNEETKRILGQLKAALEDIEISLSEHNGIIRWQGKDMETPWDLSVHPSITDPDQVYTLSKNMIHGQGVVDLFLAPAVQKMREIQQEGIDLYGTWLGIPLGNFLYCVHPQHIGEYFYVPIGIVSEMLSASEDQERGNYLMTIGEGVAVTTVFTFSANLVTQLKRFSIGGGTMHFRPIRNVLRFIPVASQIELMPRIFGLSKELVVLKQLQSRIGIRAARRAMVVLGKANIFPEYLGKIKYAQTADELINVTRFWKAGTNTQNVVAKLRSAMKSGVGILESIEELREALKKAVVDRMRHVRTFSPLSAESGWFTRVEDPDDLFNQVADLYGSPKKEEILSSRRGPPLIEVLNEKYNRVVDKMNSTILDINNPSHDALVRKIASSSNPDELIEFCKREGVDKVAGDLSLLDTMKTSKVSHVPDAPSTKPIQSSPEPSVGQAKTSQASSDAPNSPVSKVAPDSPSPKNPIISGDGAETRLPGSSIPTTEQRNYVGDLDSTASQREVSADAKGKKVATDTPVNRIRDITEESPHVRFQREIDDVFEMPRGPARAEALERILNNSELERVAAANPKSNAAVLKRGAEAARSSKYFTTGMIGLGLFIDTWLIIDNRMQIQKADESGNLTEANLLRNREKTLTLGGAAGAAIGGLDIAGSAFAGPLGIVLVAEMITAESLYSYARETMLVDADFHKMSPEELLRRIHDAPFTSWSDDLARSVAGEDKKARRDTVQSLCHGYLLQHALYSTEITMADREEAVRRFSEYNSFAQKQLLDRHSSESQVIASILENVLKDRIVMNVRMEMEYLRTRSNVPSALDFRMSEDLVKMYELRDSMQSANCSPIVTFFSEPGKEEILDLSDLPERNALPKRNEFDNRESIRRKIIQFERYELSRQRAEAIVLGETSGWEAASDRMKQSLLRSMRHTITSLEMKIGQTFRAPLDFDLSGGLFGFQANAVRYEMRKKVLSGVTSMLSAAFQKDASNDRLWTMLSNFEQTLMKLDLNAVYESAPIGHDNPIKHAIYTGNNFSLLDNVKIEQSYPGGAAAFRKEAAVSGQKAIEAEIGFPAEDALMSLVKA